MDESAETNQIVLAMLEFLGVEYRKSSTTSDSKESIEVAIQCLETAFNTNLRDQKYKGKYGLREMFKNMNRANVEPNWSGAQNPLAELFANFTPPGAGDNARPSEQEGSLGPEYSQPPEASADSKTQAEEHKTMGNDFMKNGDYNSALTSYGEAIKLDGRNAVYFCNRAAAYQKLNQLDKALRDCQVACQLQPDYARAYGRMGVTYSTLGNHHKALGCYRKAVELEPSNESYVNNLRVSEEVIASGSGDGASAHHNSPQISLQGIFNNPSLINMATQMLQDPNMQSMMRTIMTEYQAPAGAGGEQLNMNGLLQVGEAMANQIRMSNPNLVNEISSRLGGQQPPGNNNPGPGDQPNQGNQ